MAILLHTALQLKYIKWFQMSRIFLSMDTKNVFHTHKTEIKKQNGYLQERSHWRDHGVLGNLCIYMQPIKERKPVAKTK